MLGKYVRDEKLMSLQEAVQRMTGAAAAQIGIRDRGLIRDRYLADLVVFNPATVKDNATYERPHQYPTGIEHVVVNGVLVLDPKGLTGARPGRPVVWARKAAMKYVGLLIACVMVAAFCRYLRLRCRRRLPPPPRLRLARLGGQVGGQSADRLGHAPLAA